MCGFLGNVLQDPLLSILEVIGENAEWVDVIREIVWAGPASSIDIITAHNSKIQVQPAVWWLLLEKSAQGGFKPSRYTSFNSRSDKLNTPGSAAFTPFRESRCIIPATYVIEGEGPKNARRYHRIEATRQQFALGGLYRRWRDSETGEWVHSCSVVTLPPHPAWRDIHSKSTPLFLPTDADVLRRWLDPAQTDVRQFMPLLQPHLPNDLRGTPIERPGNQRALGDSFSITVGGAE